MLYGSGKGRHEQEYFQLWDDLVPISGQADTVQGELVRAIGRLAGELERNGNGNWDDGFRRFVRFLRDRLSDPAVFDKPTRDLIGEDLRQIEAIGEGTAGYSAWDEECAYDRVTDRVVEWCRLHPEPITRQHDPQLHR
jgi:hypothetical protein